MNDGVFRCRLFVYFDKIVEKILKYDFEMPNQGYYALSNAAGENHYESCRLLLEKGCAIKAIVGGLTMSAFRSYEDIVDLLLEYLDGQIDLGNEFIDSDCLIMAARGGNPSIVKKISQNHANFKKYTDKMLI